MNIGIEGTRYGSSIYKVERRLSALRQLRDGSSAGDAKRKAGMPAPRGGSSRLPGGACIPPVLEGWKHKILLAGKYLNVIRECGIGVTANRDVTVLDTGVSMEDEKYSFVPAC